MTGNVQLYLAEVGRALTRMAGPLVGFGGRVKVQPPDANSLRSEWLSRRNGYTRCLQNVEVMEDRGDEDHRD